MSQAAWGSATTKTGGGSADPNILKLADQTRIRPLDAGGPRRWRQHGMQSPTDHEQFRSVVCPRGFDGRTNAHCPLCAKPSTQVMVPIDPAKPDLGMKKENKQLFPISNRYATNVWDYESGEVKILIGGKQIFEEFDAEVAAGYMPHEWDFIIVKMGSGLQTKYKVRRGGNDPLPKAIGPDDLHDLDKYEAVPTVEGIFATLDQLGIDYDAITLPSFTLEEARDVMLPYTKNKGLTMEQWAEQDVDHMMWLYGEKRGQGQFGDEIFQAMHTVLLSLELVDDLPEVAPPPPRPAAGTSAATSDTGMKVALIPPEGGEPQEMPVEATDALKAAGWTEPKPPEPDPEPEPQAVKLKGPDDAVQEYPPTAVDALLGAGFTRVDETPPDPTPAPEAKPEPLPDLPGDDQEVQAVIGGTEVSMVFGTAKGLVDGGTAEFVGDLQALYNRHKAGEATTVPTPAESSPQTSDSTAAAPTSDQNLDSSLTEGPDDEGMFTHPALDKPYKTKGAVTQALKRLSAKAAESNGGPAAAPAQTTTAANPPSSAEMSEQEQLIEENRGLLQKMPEISGDFNELITLFKEVTGGKKQSIQEFDVAELQALREKLNERIAARA